jgi:hypothetical protein
MGFSVCTFIPGSSSSQSFVEEERPSYSCLFYARNFKGKQEKRNFNLLGVDHDYVARGVYWRGSK